MVRFAGQQMRGVLALASATTIVAVVRDSGTAAPMSSVLAYDSFRGLDITPSGCSTGYPVGPGDCSANDAKRVVSADWYGSGDIGYTNLTAQLSVVSVTYGLGGNPDIASSTVNGCSQHVAAGVRATHAAPSEAFFVGGRDDGYGRYFHGGVYEILVYNRSLTDAELTATTRALQLSYNTTSGAPCGTPPTPDLNISCAALLHSEGLAAAKVARLNSFVQKLSTAPDLNQTLPLRMALAALDYTNGFNARCAGLNNGTVPPLSTLAGTMASLSNMLQAAGSIFEGLANSLANRYALPSAEPLAKRVANLWNETQAEA